MPKQISYFLLLSEQINNKISMIKCFIQKQLNWATIIDIHIIKKSEQIDLLINDNGKGMDNFELYKNKGLGWKSIFSGVQNA